MEEWREVHLYPFGSYPCEGCQTGWASQISKVENGKHHINNDDCSETCQRLKDWKEGKNGA